MGGSVPTPSTRNLAGRPKPARMRLRRTSSRNARRLVVLAAQTEPVDQCLVARLFPRLQIVEEAAALRHELQETTAGVVVLLVVLEMLGQVLDALRQDCDLDFRRTGVALGRRKFRQQFF